MQNNILSPISEIIEDAKNGKMFILIDDCDRENEGDFIVSAEHITTEQMTIMINYASGIVCLVIDEEKRKKLNLDLQTKCNINDPLSTAFLTSIEAAKDVTTGVSSKDRVTTIKATLNDAKGDSIVTPGHVFPLLCNSGGLNVRRGHTEASLEIMKLAGLKNNSAVLCEIMNKDGTMSRLDELSIIAKELGMKIGCIADLADYINKKAYE